MLFPLREEQSLVNTMKKSLLLPYFLALFLPLTAQHLSGVVRDAASKETLVGVSVYAPTTGAGVVTDAFGRYVFPLPQTGNTIRLRFGYVGYPPLDTVLAIGAGRLDIELRQDLNLPEVVVSERPYQAPRQLGIVALPIEKLNRVPSLMGETDPIKALTIAPGVSSGVEGTADLYVRGGTPDQNLILLDGARVYNANHLFGFLSPFNPDLLKDVTLYKGAFPSKFGGRLSSIVDVTAKEGNKTKWKKSASIGTLNARIAVEGPLVKDRLSISIGGRTTYLGLLDVFTAGSVDGYLFYDLNAKLNYQTEKSNLSVSAFSSYDRWTIAESILRAPSEQVIDWGNRTLSGRYAYQLSNSVYAKALVTYNKYEYGVNQSIFDEMDRSIEINRIENLGFIEELDTKLEVDINLGRRFLLNTGVEIGRRALNPRELTITAPDSPLEQSSFATETVNEISPFADLTFSASEKWLFEVGLRNSRYQLPGAPRTFRYYEPRAKVVRQLTERTSLQLAYAFMSQPLHLLTGNFIGAPNNLWVPANLQAPPQSADHFSVGLERTESFGRWSAEVYYKYLDQLVDQLPGTDFYQSNVTNWINLVSAFGEGRAYGAEFFLEAQKGRCFGWAAYTLSWNQIRFDDVNNGQWYFRQFDRRHDLTLTGGYDLGNKWTLLTTFTFNSGFRATLPTAIYFDGFTRESVPVYQERYNAKSPVYHRLDVAFERKVVKRSGKFRQFTTGVYNAYGRRNPFYIIPEPDEDALDGGVLLIEGEVKQFSVFNLIPYVSYSFSL